MERPTIPDAIAAIRPQFCQRASAQMLEDVTDLVFIEHYMLAFANKHPEYDEEKWLDIVRKTWKKMSERAQQFALAGNITLPEPLVPLILKAVG